MLALENEQNKTKFSTFTSFIIFFLARNVIIIILFSSSFKSSHWQMNHKKYIINMISDWILNLKLLLNLLYVGYLDFKITMTGTETLIITTLARPVHVERLSLCKYSAWETLSVRTVGISRLPILP